MAAFHFQLKADCRLSIVEVQKSKIKNQQSAIFNTNTKIAPSNSEPTDRQKSVAKNSESHPVYPVHPCEFPLLLVLKDLHDFFV